jgi:transposase InsO family protein
LTWLDDHSRYALSVTAHHRVTGPAVLNAFRAATAAHGAPASTLTDNGMVFTTRLSGGRGGRNGLEHELRRLGISQTSPGLGYKSPRLNDVRLRLSRA